MNPSDDGYESDHHPYGHCKCGAFLSREGSHRPMDPRGFLLSPEELEEMDPEEIEAWQEAHGFREEEECPDK